MILVKSNTHENAYTNDPHEQTSVISKHITKFLSDKIMALNQQTSLVLSEPLSVILCVQNTMI